MRNSFNGLLRAIAKNKDVISKQDVRHSRGILGDRKSVIRMLIHQKLNSSTHHLLSNDAKAR